MTLLFFGSWLLNAYAFPKINEVGVWLKDIAQIIQGCILVVVAVAAELYPVVSGKRFLPLAMVGCSALTTLVGLVCTMMGSSSCMVFWAICHGIGSGML